MACELSLAQILVVAPFSCFRGEVHSTLVAMACKLVVLVMELTSLVDQDGDPLFPRWRGHNSRSSVSRPEREKTRAAGTWS